MKTIKINTMEILYHKTKGLTYSWWSCQVPETFKMSTTLFYAQNSLLILSVYSIFILSFGSLSRTF